MLCPREVREKDEMFNLSVLTIHVFRLSALKREVDIGLNILSMVVCGIVAYLLLLAIEYGAIKWIMTYIKRNVFKVTKAPKDDDSDLDDDVLIENEFIDNMTEDHLRSQSIVMQNVSKLYGQFCAVNKVSLSIKRYT